MLYFKSPIPTTTRGLFLRSEHHQTHNLALRRFSNSHHFEQSPEGAPRYAPQVSTRAISLPCGTLNGARMKKGTPQMRCPLPFHKPHEPHLGDYSRFFFPPFLPHPLRVSLLRNSAINASFAIVSVWYLRSKSIRASYLVFLMIFTIADFFCIFVRSS